MSRALKTLTEYRVSWIYADGEIIDCDHYATLAVARRAARPVKDAASWLIERVVRKAYADDRAPGRVTWDIDSEVDVESGEWSEAT